MRLYTRRGYNWSYRFPLIVQAVTRLKAHSVIIDGEAVVCGKDGRSDFDMLHSQIARATTTRSCSTPSILWSWMATTGERGR